MGLLRRITVIGIPLALALTLAACGSSPHKGHAGTKSGSGKSTTTTTVSATTTTIAPAVHNSLNTAITAYQTSQGLQASQYTITHIEVSAVDSSWALFSVIPTANEVNFQGGYGFVHEVNGNWSVVGFGSSNVGCPPGAKGNKVLPANILNGFHLGCSSTPS
jgi:hypothetical protein